MRAIAPISPLQGAERVCCLRGPNWDFAQELFHHFYTVNMAAKACSTAKIVA